VLLAESGHRQAGKVSDSALAGERSAVYDQYNFYQQYNFCAACREALFSA
jgi:hypothetical protein